MTLDEVIADLAEEAKAWAAKGMGRVDNTSRIVARMFENSGIQIEDRIDRARAGDQGAHSDLCGIAAMLMGQNKTMPENLRMYIAGKLAEEFVSPGKRAKGRQTNWPRNLVIVGALERLRRAGLNPTLNPATQDHNPELRSGCRIVADLLGEVGIKIGESGVADVWRDYGESILEGLKGLKEISR